MKHIETYKTNRTTTNRETITETEKHIETESHNRQKNYHGAKTQKKKNMKILEPIFYGAKTNP